MPKISKMCEKDSDISAKSPSKNATSPKTKTAAEACNPNFSKENMILSSS